MLRDRMSETIGDHAGSRRSREKFLTATQAAVENYVRHCVASGRFPARRRHRRKACWNVYWA